MRVQTLSTEMAVERFDERIVGRLARTNSLVTECDYAAAAFCFRVSWDGVSEADCSNAKCRRRFRGERNP